MGLKKLKAVGLVCRGTHKDTDIDTEYKMSDSTDSSDSGVYTVVEFGCNSSHNDMYPPTVHVFKSKTSAYAYYNSLKTPLQYDGCVDYPVKTHVYTYANGEATIQDGDEVKRPSGVSITYSKIH